MSRPAAVLAAAGLAAAAVLTACDKPTPNVTLQTGSTSTIVKPQTYCFDVGHCRYTIRGNVGSIKAKQGSTILVDVPKEVSKKNWVVQSGQESNGTFTPLTGAGVNTATLHNRHSARVTVPYGSGTYLLVVNQVANGRGTGSWVSTVTIEN